jgi:hypothetical protein
MSGTMMQQPKQAILDLMRPLVFEICAGLYYLDM